MTHVLLHVTGYFLSFTLSLSSLKSREHRSADVKKY
jgi:hypothetical protein